MRISDWSSDVCSSDLTEPLRQERLAAQLWDQRLQRENAAPPGVLRDAERQHGRVVRSDRGPPECAADDPACREYVRPTVGGDADADRSAHDDQERRRIEECDRRPAEPDRPPDAP